MYQQVKKKTVVVIVFLLASVFAITAVYFAEQYAYQQKRLVVQKLASSYASIISTNIHNAISAAYPLAALVKTQQGEVQGFTELATQMLPLYPGISALQLLPKGIVKYVVPIEGNEAAIGHNVLLKGDRYTEALLALDTGKLTLAGPFNVIQGDGIGAVARLPIFLNDRKGAKYFWGFSAVLFRLPETLETVDLASLEAENMAYELSRIHPDTHKAQVISQSKKALINNPEIFEIDVPNGRWLFKVSPVDSWQNYFAIGVMSALGVIFIFLITLTANVLLRLRNSQEKLEQQVGSRTKALADNLKRLDIAMSSAKQAWFDLDLQSNELVVSDEVAKLFGFDEGELDFSLRSWQDNIHPEDEVYVAHAIQISMETGNSLNIDYRLRTKEGGWLWTHTQADIVSKDKSNKPQRLVGIHTDISERKASEQVLRILAEGAGTSDSVNIFQLMVKELAMAQQCSFALIAQINPSDLSSVNTVAVWGNGEIVENINYFLLGTPCENVIKDSPHFYPDNIQALFPKDYLLAEMQAESYLGVPLKNSKNKVVGLVVLMDDKPMVQKSFTMTLLDSLATRAGIELERMNSDEALKLSSKVFSNAHEGIMITDTEGLIIQVNPTFCAITGYSAEEVIGKNPRLLSSGKQDSAFFTAMWQSIAKDGYWQGEVWNRKKGGELYAELLSISKINNDVTGEISHYVGLFSDITQSKQQQSTLELMANYDVLTQLPNRVLFADRFNLAMAHAQRSGQLLAVCFLDLDQFKPVNDNYGHAVGDLLLMEVAKRIKGCIREEDTVSRQGGDEFTLLLIDLESPQQCEKMLERIHNTLALPYLIEAHEIHISASSGVTLYPNDNSDLDGLVRHADQAMYQAKMVGRNRYQIFNTEQDQQSISKQHRLEELQQALENNEFCLYYQPKVNMQTGKVFGAEALIRWIHPEKGLIPPLDFLPIIESTELEILVGDWVIQQALDQLECWQNQGINIEVSVNISSNHLQSATFFSNLEQAMLDHAAVSHQNFQLEILESSALGDLDTIAHVIKQCRDKLGVNVALDDFGTGYSSLTHLRSLPANTIKIDQSFVRDMLDDPSDYAIIEGVIGLAKSFGRGVIAEGVETTEHGLMLLIMGCYEAQGYGIAKPMPADEVLNWLQSYTANKQWLNAANKPQSRKERRIKILRLTSEQWYKKFTNKVLNTSSTATTWPIDNSVKCHIGRWIQRTKHERVFDAVWLEKVDKVHTEMHGIANEIILLYQENKHNEARQGLPALELVFDKMKQVLGEWE